MSDFNDFSNPASKRLYLDMWPKQPAVRAQYEEGAQCGCCAYFQKKNSDYGVCGNPQSPHKKETVFEHFSCVQIRFVGWS